MSHLSNLSSAIFLDVNSFSIEEFTNGATLQYREIFRRLMRRNVKCAVVTFTHHPHLFAKALPAGAAPERAYHHIGNVPIIEYLLKESPEEEPEPYSRFIEQALRELAPDLIIINTPPSRLYEIEVRMAELLAQSGIPIMCFVPDDHFPRPETCEADRYQRFQQSIQSFRLFAPSRFIAKRAGHTYGRELELFHNLFTVEDILCHENGDVADDPTERQSITLINPHPLKGIEIFEAIAKEMACHNFTVVRGWPYPPTYRCSVPNIKVLPFMRSLRRVWRETKLLLVPSLCHEGYGRVVVEAMLNGIPVIGHRVGGLPEASGGGAVLIEPPPIHGTAEHPRLDPEDLARSTKAFITEIEDILRDPPRYTELSSNAAQIAANICADAERGFASVFDGFKLPASESVSRNKVMILSPHPDDVAFSIGGTLLKRPFRGAALMVTMFGRSNHLSHTGFHADWASVTSIRQAEDRAFAEQVGIELNYCELPEASLRLAPSYEVLFADNPFDEVVIPSEAREALMGITADFRPSHIIAPLGLGNHKDHLAVRNLAQEIARSLNIKLLYYEDLPYAAELSAAEIQQHISLISPAHRPLNLFLNGDLHRKMELVISYVSQSSDETNDLILKHALSIQPSEGAERLWITDAALELFSHMSA